MLELAKTWATGNGVATVGDRLVLTAGLPISRAGTTNLLYVIDVEP